LLNEKIVRILYKNSYKLSFSAQPFVDVPLFYKKAL
jgi:hypothetical protein